jgi:hypothetical protein
LLVSGIESGLGLRATEIGHGALDFFSASGYGFCAMRKLAEVEEAKALMTEAMDWSVFTWLFQKSKVREVADEANAALDKLNKSTKARWSEEIKLAYKALPGKGRRQEELTPSAIDPEIQIFVKKVKEADDAARRARRDAEDTFDDAERTLNTDLAREGCRKAIHQWELDEKAIRKAEAIPGSGKTAS